MTKVGLGEDRRLRDWRKALLSRPQTALELLSPKYLEGWQSHIVSYTPDRTLCRIVQRLDHPSPLVHLW